MAFVDGEVVVRQVDGKLWEVQESVTYKGRDGSFVVPPGFRTDFASIPRLVVWLIPRYGIYTRAAILHDFLCSTRPVSRADADGLFRRSMRELGVSVPRRWMMWAGVRAASGMSDADIRQWLWFAIVAPPALLFVIIPAVVVQVFLTLFWFVELAAWVGGRALQRTDRPVPRLQIRAA